MLSHHRPLASTLTGLTLALALSLGACDDSASPGGARLSIMLTDAAGDLEEAWVEITGIYLQPTQATQGQRVWLLQSSTGLIDLLTLSDAAVDLVNDEVVPPGTYAQLRFIIGDAVIKTVGGKVYATAGAVPPGGLVIDGPLQCPSCLETGLKVNLPGGAVTLADEATILVVDFDVSQSFGREVGPPVQWVMHPLLSASEFGLTGSIAGTVTLAQGVTLPSCGGRDATVSDFVPVASAGGIEKSGDVNADGSYTISFVEPGDYDMGFAPVQFDNGETLTFQATHPSMVNVQSGATATADYTITGASCS